MWVESNEWTKFGGKAVFCFCLLTGWSSRLSWIEMFCKIVEIMFLGLTYLYGYTQGRPRGVIHLTGSPVLATTLAHFANHSFILLASLNRSPIHLMVIFARYWDALYRSPFVSYILLSLSCRWIYFLAPMKVTPYTDVITVCLITFLVTFPFNPSATSIN